eukprot:gene31480-6667_t
MDGGIADSGTENGGVSDGEEVEDIQEAVDERVWSTIMNLCKGSGLSDGDIESVLDMIGSLYESGCKTSLRTLTQWKRYTNDKVNRASTLIIGPNLNSSIITVSKDDVPALGEAIVKAEFYHEDMNKFLRTEFANVKYQGQFVMHAQRLVDINGSRYKTRVKNYCTVAYFPIYKKDALMNDNTQRLVKLSMYSKCLNLLLKPMKEASHTESGLWGFKDGDTDKGSSSWAFASDGMHNDDLGVFLYIVKHMKAYLKDKYGRGAEGKVQILNSRLQCTDLPRAPDFSLPYNDGKYIQAADDTGLGRIHAKEHRNVMQVLPHILHDIDPDMCHLAAR